MDKRYQIFVSSTYADLKEERRRVIQALIELDCIPAGMELFPATDEDQLEFIKRIIDDCDYYLLIIGGRYGSTTPEGISYTEREYEYALGRNLRVIALLHENPDEISYGKSEHDPALRARLQSFRDRVATGRLVKMWKSAEELPGIVALSLSKTIKTFPAIGWIRADRASSEETLSEINELRKENARLQQTITGLKPVKPVENLAGLDESFELHGKRFLEGRYWDWKARATWSELFAFISPYLVQYPNQALVQRVLGQALFEKSDTSGSYSSLDDQDFQTVSVQLRALGLVKVEYAENVKGGMGLFWSATPSGDQLMFRLRVIRTVKKEAQVS